MKKMKTGMVTFITATIAMGFSCLSMADLSTGTTIALFEGDNPSAKPAIEISVCPGKTAYTGNGVHSVSGVIGDGTLLDYRFYNGVGASDGSLLNTYANGVFDIIGEATVIENDRPGEGFADIWITSAPESDGSLSPDFEGDKSADSLTSAVGQDIHGTIDISCITQGSVYMIYGSFLDNTTVTVTMSGTGQPDLKSTYTASPGSPRICWWMTEFKFKKTEGYDTIIFHYGNDDTDGSRAHFMGVMVDAEFKINTVGFMLAHRD